MGLLASLSVRPSCSLLSLNVCSSSSSASCSLKCPRTKQSLLREINVSSSSSVFGTKLKKSYGAQRCLGFQFSGSWFLPPVSSARPGQEEANVPIEPSIRPIPGLSCGSDKSLRLIKTSTLSTRWITGLSAVGLSATSYLTLMKLVGGPVVCPVGGDSCNSVLDSSYSIFFGIPLSLVGMVMYGLVAFLSWSMMENRSTTSIEKGLRRWFLLASTTAMATASAYLMYILQVELGGTFCAYCIGSALLSFSLLLLTLRVFSSQDWQSVAGLQLATIATLVVVFSAAFENSSALAGSADIDLPPVEPEITTVSNSENISLAKHLSDIGAKMYGAFWCSHCHEQKEMFGREATKFLDYVECFPDGYWKGVKIAKSCEERNIQGFPSWIINNQVISGEQDLQELARISGFNLSKPSK